MDMHLVRVCPHWYTEGPSETEVCQLEIIALVNKQVLWLEIAVEDAVRVTIEKAGGHLMREFLMRDMHQNTEDKNDRDAPGRRPDKLGRLVAYNTRQTRRCAPESSGTNELRRTNLGNFQTEGRTSLCGIFHVSFQITVQKFKNEVELLVGMNNVEESLGTRTILSRILENRITYGSLDNVIILQLLQ